MRYSRQEKFLEKISSNKIDFSSKIVIVGCGGVGSVLSELLVRGGFLNLVLVDNDLIDETNLGRQNFEEKDIGNFKSKTLSKRLKKINSNFKGKVYVNILTEENISKICDDSSLIIDCTDNFETRRLINSYCTDNSKDWIYSGAVKSEIITCTFYYKNNLFDKVFSNEVINESCCNVGVLASTTFSCASLVYNQVLKYFLGIRENKLIKIDLWKGNLFEVKLK